MENIKQILELGKEYGIFLVLFLVLAAIFITTAVTIYKKITKDGEKREIKIQQIYTDTIQDYKNREVKTLDIQEKSLNILSENTKALTIISENMDRITQSQEKLLNNQTFLERKVEEIEGKVDLIQMQVAEGQTIPMPTKKVVGRK